MYLHSSKHDFSFLFRVKSFFILQVMSHCFLYLSVFILLKFVGLKSREGRETEEVEGGSRGGRGVGRGGRPTGRCHTDSGSLRPGRSMVGG